MPEEQSILDGMALLYIGAYRQEAGDFYSGVFYEKTSDGTHQRTADGLITCDNLNDVVVLAAQQKGLAMQIITHEPAHKIGGEEYAPHLSGHGYAPLNPFEMRDAKTIMGKIRGVLNGKPHRKADKRAAKLSLV